MGKNWTNRWETQDGSFGAAYQVECSGGGEASNAGADYNDTVFKIFEGCRRGF